MSRIPLGILAGSGAGAGNALTLISTVYGTGSSGTITFSSIPSTYKHLQLRIVAKSTAGSNLMRITFNGSTTGYTWHKLEGNGSTVSSSTGISATSITLPWVISESGTANAHSGSILDILDYANASKNKTTRLLSGQKDWNNQVNLSSGLWSNTAAISSISLVADGSINISSSSRFSLYGVS